MNSDGIPRLHLSRGRALRRALLVAACAIFVVVLGRPPALAQKTINKPLAEVNGEGITDKDLETSLATKLSKLEEQIYALKRDELENLIAQRLLAQEAAKRGMSVPALLDAEVTSKVGLITEQEIDEFYNENKARLRGDEASLRERIRSHLQQQKLS